MSVQCYSGQVTNKMMLVAEVSRRPLSDCENGDPVITMVATVKPHRRSDRPNPPTSYVFARSSATA